jgi:hypothetical protein
MGSRRTRNILAVAALLIIVLIAGITLSRLFFGETTENTELARAEVEELVTPEPVAAKTASTEKKETFPKRDIPDELKPLEEEKLPETPAKTTPPESNVKTENKKASISDTVTKKTEKPKTPLVLHPTPTNTQPKTKHLKHYLYILFWTNNFVGTHLVRHFPCQYKSEKK